MAQYKVHVVRVSIGLIGWIAGRPHVRLEKELDALGQEGWEVVQILPEQGSNALQSLLTILVLVCTLLLWAPGPGYMVVLKGGDW